MDVKSMGKNLSEAIQKNLKPISNINLKPLKQRLSLRPKKQAEQQKDGQIWHNLQIQQQYQCLKQNINIDYKTSIKIVSCLKLADSYWKQYQNITNKNGQISALYLAKFQKINIKFQNILKGLLISGSLQQVRKCNDFFMPIINFLSQKSRKFYAHQNQFKIISKKVQQNKKQQFQQQQQIKEEMIDLVERFKTYALNIQEDLVKDKDVIEQINKSQDQQLNSLQKRSESMQDIINQQRLGFFQLLIMGIVAALVWVFGLAIIIIV